MPSTPTLTATTTTSSTSRITWESRHFSAPTIERCARALDDSTNTQAGGKDITVTLVSDVAFASDSADLAPGAAAQLKTVATQLGQHPDGGTLTIDHPEGKYSLKGAAFRLTDIPVKNS